MMYTFRVQISSQISGTVHFKLKEKSFINLDIPKCIFFLALVFEDSQLN